LNVFPVAHKIETIPTEAKQPHDIESERLPDAREVLTETASTVQADSVSKDSPANQPPSKDEAKRKRDPVDIHDEEPPDKILRAMMALLDHIDSHNEGMDEEWALLSSIPTSTAIEADIPIPKTYEAAVADPIYGKMWFEAIEEEIRTLLQNHTWTEVITPPGVNLVDTKWVFTVKRKLDGTVDRFKARLGQRFLSTVRSRLH
jgi:hypothetical protein